MTGFNFQSSEDIHQIIAALENVRIHTREEINSRVEKDEHYYELRLRQARVDRIIKQLFEYDAQCYEEALQSDESS